MNMTEDSQSILKANNTLLRVENIITAIVVAILLWVGSEVNTVGKTVIQLETKQDNILAQLENQRRLGKLELQTLDATVTGKVSSIEAEVKQLHQNDTQQWPRLRTHGENIAILRTEIEKLCNCNLHLKEPEKF